MNGTTDDPAVLTVWFDDDCGLCSTVVGVLGPRTDPGVA